MSHDSQLTPRLLARSNRLWFEGPEPERSEGRVEVSATAIDYTWSFRGQGQEGRIRLFGVEGALRAEWADSWHAKEGAVDLRGQR